MLFRWLAALLFAATVLSARAQNSSDLHVSGDPASSLFRRSAFMHGYMHGYESGFHAADLDLHLGRGTRDISRMKEFQEAKAGYQRAFGDRRRFQQGFQCGFRNGYADSISGREFQAVTQARMAAQGFSENPADGQRVIGNFDEGFATGYHGGWESGRIQPRMAGETQTLAGECRVYSEKQGFCEGYARGFRMGLLSGFASQQTQASTTASAEANSRSGNKGIP
jgi:hypothetical protein